jgi:hypothetical protein
MRWSVGVTAGASAWEGEAVTRIHGKTYAALAIALLVISGEMLWLSGDALAFAEHAGYQGA